MKLFFVLYVAGQISGTWGPLPYDIDECQRRAVERRADIAAHPELSTWTVACEWHEARPKLGARHD